MTDQKHVLVSGGSGFVASHIIDLLIKQDYAVTATVRTSSKGEEILKLHPEWKEALTFVYIPDIAVENAFDEAFKTAKVPFTYIIHTASPVTFAVKDLKKDLVDPAIQGTLRILDSAHTHGSASISRLVLLGSAVAILNSFEDTSRPGKPYTEADWNPVTLEDALAQNSPVLAYNYSKKAAEQAAWEFLREHDCSFDMAVINPDIIIGPLLQPVASKEKVNETNVFAVYSFLTGVHKTVEEVRFPFYHFVDVRDVARAHVIAMTEEAAGGKRILQVSGLIAPRLVCGIIGRRFRELRGRLPGDWEENVGLPAGVSPTGWDGKASEEVLSKGGVEWRYKGLEESVVDTVQSLLEWEGRWESGK